MKNLLAVAFVAIAIPALSVAVACAPDEVIEPRGCADYYRVPSNAFVGDLVVTDEDGGVVSERSTLVVMYASGGAGVYWGGVAGTAVGDYVSVDYALEFLELRLVGQATATGGSFDQWSGETFYRFEFTNLRPYDEAGATAYGELTVVDLSLPGAGVLDSY